MTPTLYNIIVRYIDITHGKLTYTTQEEGSGFCDSINNEYGDPIIYIDTCEIWQCLLRGTYEFKNELQSVFGQYPFVINDFIVDYFWNIIAPNINVEDKYVFINSN